MYYLGDWLKSINDTLVHVNNIDDICRELSLPSKVCFFQLIVFIEYSSDF